MDAGQILLVEDNLDDVDLARDALQRNRLPGSLRVARDGVEAMELILGRDGVPPFRPRLVLLDLKMPRLDGLEVLKRLKTDPATQAIPVVMLTSSNQERDISACYRLGANGYVVKPVEFTQFLKTAEAICAYWLGQNQPCPAHSSSR